MLKLSWMLKLLWIRQLLGVFRKTLTYPKTPHNSFAIMVRFANILFITMIFLYLWFYLRILTKLWNKPYDKWPSLHEYSEHLYDVKKDRVHNSFKKEIEILKKLFSDDHPAHQRLTHLECQLKVMLFCFK